MAGRFRILTKLPPAEAQAVARRRAKARRRAAKKICVKAKVLRSGAMKPKRPFALFYEEQKKANALLFRNEAGGSIPGHRGQTMMREAAKMWKDLPQMQKDEYQRQASELFANMRDALVVERRRERCAAACVRAVEAQDVYSHLGKRLAADIQGLPMRVCSDNSPTQFKWTQSAEHLIGSGSFGCVYHCSDVATGHAFAVKVFEDEEAFGAELQSLTMLQQGTHQLYFPRLYGSHDGDCIHAVFMEKFDCDVRALLLSEGAVIPAVGDAIINQMCEALAFLHGEVQLVHTDVKASNVLWLGVARRAALADFSSAESRASPLDHVVTTLNYRAPEVFVGSRNRQISPAIDIWSFGCLSWEVASVSGGYSPRLLFPGRLDKNIQYGHKCVFESSSEASALLRMAGAWLTQVRGCLQRKPCDRLLRTPANSSSASSACG